MGTWQLTLYRLPYIWTDDHYDTQNIDTKTIDERRWGVGALASLTIQVFSKIAEKRS